MLTLLWHLAGGSLPGTSLIKFRFENKLEGQSFFNNLQGLLSGGSSELALIDVYK